MNKQLHRAITVFLMCCFCISALSYLFFDIAQLDFKIDAKDRIGEEGTQFQTIKLSLKEFRSGKEDELWYNGDLYDVRSYVIMNDTVYVSVRQDGNEEQLIKNIAESFNPDGQALSNDIAHVCKYHTHGFDGGKILVPPYKIAWLTADNQPYLPLPYLVKYTRSSYFDVIKPPPRCATVINS